LLKALLLEALYSIPSERRLVEAISWNLHYRWFCDIQPDAEMWEATAFTHNRERLERHGLVQKFFERVVATALIEQYASNDQFTVDGTLIQSWASLKSFRPKDEPRDQRPSDGGSNPSVNFRGERRTNETHRSTTDPEARLARKSKGQPALLGHSGHALTESRHGLCLDIAVAEANGRAERQTAKQLLRRFRRRHRIQPETVAVDRG
jgi:transposase